MKSIFELERRFDFDMEYEMLSELVQRLNFCDTDNDHINLLGVIDRTFDHWPFNENALNVEHYFRRIIPYFAMNNLLDIEENNERMLMLDFLINYIDWLKIIFIQDYNTDFIELFNHNITKITKLIAYILEHLNYTIKKGQEHLYIIKRNENVDSILSIVKECDIRELFLSFYDFRVEGNLEEKRLILKQIADYLEPKRNNLNSFNPSLTNDVFFILNNFNIRHNNKETLKFKSNEEHLEWYDKLFKMIIQLIRTEEICKIQKELKEYKK